MMRRASLLLATLGFGAALAASPAAYADDASYSTVKVDLANGSASQSLVLPQGRSAIVDLPSDVRDVLVSNPQVATAVVRTPRRILVVGAKYGVTDAVFFDAAGHRILSLNIRVDPNTTILSDTINRILPGAQVKVDAINDSVILSGMVANPSDADRAVKIAQATVTDPNKVLNMLSIAGKDQVMLRVRVVEMNREVIKQLGFNWNAVIGQVGSPQFMLGSMATYGVNGALLGGLSAGSSLNTTTQPESKIASANPILNGLPIVCRVCTNGGQGTISTIQSTAGSTGLNQATGQIQAFERVGLVRTLAEPNLTAVSGESAKFLAGGEFPVPTSETVTGQVSVEFKPFGVGLGFTPVVLSNGRISLKLSTEVSELNNQGSFSVSTGTGGPALVVPSLTVRRADTTVELPSGGAFMIAGLLQDTASQDIDSIPGVKDLPVLGALFRSRDFQANQSELVVIVSAYIVNPTSPSNLQTPIDGLQVASDDDTLLLGRLNKTYKHDPQSTTGKTYQGPYGYVVE
jgi:pilus assembly protein CpaC